MICITAQLCGIVAHYEYARTLVSSGVRAELFRLLLGVNAPELHLRELERQSGFALSTVRQELKNLVELGLVQARVSGNRTYYSGNRSHPLFPEIHGLVLKTAGLTDLLHHALGDDGIRVAFVFGSIADNSEKAASDIDLMVLGPLSLRQVASRLADLSQSIGRELNPHVMTVAEFKKRRQAKDHFVMAVLAAPKLFVVGDAHVLEAMGDERLDSAASE